MEGSHHVINRFNSSRRFDTPRRARDRETGGQTGHHASVASCSNKTYEMFVDARLVGLILANRKYTASQRLNKSGPTLQNCGIF